MISRLMLSLLLFAAAVCHGIFPHLFNDAIPFAQKREINFAVGCIELILSLGLWYPRHSDFFARACAAWFLLLLPIHLYVCLYRIPMFGIAHPAVLWARTVLQIPLYFWALSLQRRSWIMAQRWSDLIFLHYEVNPSELQKLLPYPLDLYEGKAILSVVPFIMSQIRFPFLPPIPGLSRLFELNLRTYVRVNGKPLVYFFTLDTNHWPAVLIARYFFSLPYRYRPLTIHRSQDVYELKSPVISFKAQISEQQVSTDFDRWATERYGLMTKSGRKNLMGIVEHVPWRLQQAKIDLINDQFTNLLGEQFRAVSFRSVTFAKKLDVWFRPFRSLRDLS